MSARRSLIYRVTENGCWEVISHKGNWQGYVTIKRNSKLVRVHRLSWEIKNGPIPLGLCVCHKCDNPPCINPDHLFLGTLVDNAIDMTKKGRRVVGSRHGRSKIVEGDVCIIKSLATTGETQKAIAIRFGISRIAVSDIVNGKTWKSVSGAV